VVVGSRSGRRALAGLFLIAWLFAGCGPTDSDFKRVKIGMTTKEVRAIMGEPESTKTVLGAAEQWVYRDKYVIQFALGKVVIKEKR
jgi:outer membrane protein assembly factor BamE (lipoprotein component of BamABCDE complex)